MSHLSPHLDPIWLRQKYIDEGMSTYQIAAIVKRNPKNVYQKLLDFGIPTRTRAETLKKNAWWKLGKPSRKGWNHTKATRDKIRAKATGRPGLSGSANPMYGRTGPASSNWKGGTTPERQKLYGTTEWKALVTYIYARDGYTCQKCGVGRNRTNQLHAHHIKSWAEYPAERSEPNNLITLCNGCHGWVHSHKNKTSQFIE